MAVEIKAIQRTTCGIFAAILLAIVPLFAAAQDAGVPMSPLDLQFDATKVVEIPRMVKQIGDLSRAEAALVKAKGRDKVALAEVRRQTEAARNALADLAVEYVAQMEMAEALVRLDYSQALADRYRKSFPHTLWRLDQRAKVGDARASATLGSLYRLGIVAELSEAKACDYYGRAAQKGHVAAQFHAANCGDAKSEAANRLRELAAAGGHPVAQEMKGRLCLREKPDAECALLWLGRAAAQGRASAMSLLGWIYSTGELVPRDDKRAFAYFMDAAKLGDAAAQNNVGQMYETGRGVAADGGEAFTWYKRSAEAGLGAAQVNLARSYIEGRGTAPDRAAAVSWLEMAKKLQLVRVNLELSANTVATAPHDGFPVIARDRNAETSIFELMAHIACALPFSMPHPDNDIALHRLNQYPVGADFSGPFMLSQPQDSSDE